MDTYDPHQVRAPSPSTDAPSTYKFSVVHAEERTKLGLPEDLKLPCGIGLALSGGGIRSASFALGVVQLLLNSGLLKQVDYLSTVSGGGYLGSSLSWWLHQAATSDAVTAMTDAVNQTADLKPAADQAPPDPVVRYAAFRQQFGSKVKGSRTDTGADPATPAEPWRGSNWLAYIRQHGNYLQPPGVGYASLVASVLRICLYSMSVYIAALVGVFCCTRWIEQLLGTGPRSLVDVGLVIATACAGSLAVISLAYGWLTWASSIKKVSSARLYEGRTRIRSWTGNLLSVSLCGLLIASIPSLYYLIDRHIPVWWASLSSLSLGTVGTVYQFLQGRARSRTPAPFGSLRIIVTAALVAYGLTLGAFAIAEDLPVSPWVVLITFGLSLFFGLFVNTNYAGLARLYRDRLMEAFLPGPADVSSNEWALATLADTLRVSDLKGRLERETDYYRENDIDREPRDVLIPAPPQACPRPLHLINCNAVLIDSPKDLYRNRGGDSFVITPLWSGCYATGWIKTTRLGDGNMTLATAMSISGAAANPNAGPNGLGVTRNRVVSFLMSLFNIRLGYWMANPAMTGEAPSNMPNFWYPGFRQGLLGRGLSERANFLELTDGGHFDNTGIYELVRRRTKLIVVAQGSCDPGFAMEDLANAIEKVRVDFSVFIEFNDALYNLECLRPKDATSRDPCSRGFAIGRIRYPRGHSTSPDFDDGYLIYMQAVPFKGMPADVISYWLRHKEFPNDTTADQFFTEGNLEAYRELGYAIASSMIEILKSKRNESPILSNVADLLMPVSKSKDPPGQQGVTEPIAEKSTAEDAVMSFSSA